MSPGKNDTLTSNYLLPHHRRSRSSVKVAPDKGYREIEEVFKERAEEALHLESGTWPESQAGKK